MDFPYSGYGAGDQEDDHHHHHHHQHPHHSFNKPDEDGGLYEGYQRYPLHPPQSEEASRHERERYPQGYGVPDYAPFPAQVPYPPISSLGPPDYAGLPQPVPYPPISSVPYAHHESTIPYTHHESTGSYAQYESTGRHELTGGSHHGYPHHASSGPYTHSESHKNEYSHTGPVLPQGQLVRLFCKGNSAFNLAVEHDTVIMKPANSEDEAQQWIKDSTYGLRVKDNYGYPAFALVNKKTSKMLKHAKEKGHQVLLVDYKPDMRDDDILWTESQDFGEGFKTVRSASDTLLNMTVFEGAKKIRNGSALVLDTWHKGDHQLWRLFPL